MRAEEAGLSPEPAELSCRVPKQEGGKAEAEPKEDHALAKAEPLRAMSTTKLAQELQNRIATEDELVAAYDEFGSDRKAAEGLTKRKGIIVT